MIHDLALKIDLRVSQMQHLQGRLRCGSRFAQVDLNGLQRSKPPCVHHAFIFKFAYTTAATTNGVSRMLATIPSILHGPLRAVVPHVAAHLIDAASMGKLFPLHVCSQFADPVGA